MRKGRTARIDRQRRAHDRLVPWIAVLETKTESLTAAGASRQRVQEWESATQKARRELATLKTILGVQ